jgi:hypothetical protein
MPLCASALDLQLKTADTDGGSFHFTFKSKDDIKELPIDLKADSIQTASTDHFFVWSDTDKAQADKYGNGFSYLIYARSKTGGRFSMFTFHGQPDADATFEDQIVAVTFTVGEGAQTETGSIQLPIFGFSASDSLGVPKWEKPVEVPLASELFIPVLLHNKLSGMPLDIDGSSSICRSRNSLPFSFRTIANASSERAMMVAVRRICHRVLHVSSLSTSGNSEPRKTPASVTSSRNGGHGTKRTGTSMLSVWWGRARVV